MQWYNFATCLLTFHMGNPANQPTCLLLCNSFGLVIFYKCIEENPIVRGGVQNVRHQLQYSHGCCSTCMCMRLLLWYSLHCYDFFRTISDINIPVENILSSTGEVLETLPRKLLFKCIYWDNTPKNPNLVTQNIAYHMVSRILLLEIINRGGVIVLTDASKNLNFMMTLLDNDDFNRWTGVNWGNWAHCELFCFLSMWEKLMLFIDNNSLSWNLDSKVIGTSKVLQ